MFLAEISCTVIVTWGRLLLRFHVCWCRPDESRGNPYGHYHAGVLPMGRKPLGEQYVSSPALTCSRQFRLEAKHRETVRRQFAGRYVGPGPGRSIHTVRRRLLCTSFDNAAWRSSARVRLCGDVEAARRTCNLGTQRTTNQVHDSSSQQSQIMMHRFESTS